MWRFSIQQHSKDVHILQPIQFGACMIFHAGLGLCLLCQEINTLKTCVGAVVVRRGIYLAHTTVYDKQSHSLFHRCSADTAHLHRQLFVTPLHSFLISNACLRALRRCHQTGLQHVEQKNSEVSFRKNRKALVC